MKKKIINIVCIVLILISICGNVFATRYDNITEKGKSSIDGVTIQHNSCTEEIIEPSVAARTINRRIGATLTIIEIIGRTIPIPLIVIGIYKNFIAKKKIKLYENKLNVNGREKKYYKNDDEWNALKKNKNKASVFLAFCIVMAIILFILSIITGIVRNFAAKPIIYIYPEVETEISVKLGKPEKITCSYPRYEGEWKVKASTNGNLVDLKTGRNLYCLYWEGINTNSSKIKKGFVVKGEDTAKFLEEKLEILGLNEREAEEFIIYWLPKMERNNYNYIRFETMEEINKNMPLEIEPSPDTLIRVMMEFKGLRNPIDVENQILEKAERNGYTVVEWGGTEL